MKDLDEFIVKMEQTLGTYKILLEDEKERIHKKGYPPVDIRYYEGCVNVLMSLLYLAADVKRNNDTSRAEEIIKNKQNDISSNN